MSELRRSKWRSGAANISVINPSSCKRTRKDDSIQEKKRSKLVEDEVKYLKNAKNQPQPDSDSSSSDADFHSSNSILKSQSRLPSSGKNSPPLPDFSSIENKIFSGVSQLSDSESDSDFEEVPSQFSSCGLKAGLTDDIKRSKGTDIALSQNSQCESKQRKPTQRFKKLSLQKSSRSGDHKARLTLNSSMSNGTENPKRTDGKESEESEEKSQKKDSIQLEDDSDEALSVKCKKLSAMASLQRESSQPRRPGRGTNASKAVKQSGTSSKAGASPAAKKQSRGKMPCKIETLEIKEEIPEKIDNLDVSALLALGEGLGVENKSQSHSDSEDDWEEVTDPHTSDHTFPKGGVEIFVKMPELFRHRKRRDQVDCIRAEVNRNFNRVRRELQILLHKASVLGWLAHGIFVNSVINSDHLKAVSMSLIPNDLFLTSKKSCKKDIQETIKWFRKTMECTEGFPVLQNKSSKPLLKSLDEQFSRKVSRSQREQVYMFVCTLRALGVDARLVISFQPMPLKPPSSDLLPVNPKAISKKEKDKVEQDSDVEKVKQTTDKKNQAKLSLSPTKIEKINSSLPAKQQQNTPSKKPPSKKPSHPSPDPSEKHLKQTREFRKRPARKSYVEKSESENEDCLEKKEPILSPNRNKSLSSEEKEQLKAAASKRMRGNRRSFPRAIDSGKHSSPNQKASQNLKSSVSSKKDHKSSKPSTSKDSQDSLSDSDFEPRSQSVSKSSVVKSSPKKRKKMKSKEKGMKVLSTDEDQETFYIANGSDYWVEVYLETEERWVPVDIEAGKLDTVKQILAKASQPICYVVAFNSDKTVKDVTRRYCPKFSQVNAKLRAPVDWWDKTLKSFKPKRTSKEIQEDSEMNLVELDRPMPTKIGECKNHPLYALKRHLLKFEAIYPPDAPTLGFLGNGEAIYARQNVYTLHSREIWMKEAKVVRLGEKPYKIVKARPKWDKVNCKVITDLPLEVFGPWQVEDYVPPPAVDGKVPRNAYGNVELFKPSMLPKGSVHLQVPGLNRVAKKLKIDCAPAVVGFDYHSGGCHPTYDGFVVCEEFVDVLMDAWNRDIDESAKRREEKHEKRVYGNWRRLIKGLLIREHLKHRYDFKKEAGDQGVGSSQSSVNAEALRSARVTEEEPPPPVLFPKLMAKMRAQKRSPRSLKKETPSIKQQVGKKNSKPKPMKKKYISSDEEEEAEETDWGSSSTSQDESEMILLSEEETGSESE